MCDGESEVQLYFILKNEVPQKKKLQIETYFEDNDLNIRVVRFRFIRLFIF